MNEIEMRALDGRLHPALNEIESAINDFICDMEDDIGDSISSFGFQPSQSNSLGSLCRVLESLGAEDAVAAEVYATARDSSHINRIVDGFYAASRSNGEKVHESAFTANREGAEVTVDTATVRLVTNTQPEKMNYRTYKKRWQEILSSRKA